MNQSIGSGGRQVVGEITADKALVERTPKRNINRCIAFIALLNIVASREGLYMFCMKHP
jgi:hypothetical protein